MSEWQPIETAPEGKRGEILAFKPRIGQLIVKWLDAGDGDFEGWHESWDHQPIEGLTHWMPLPAEPGSEKPRQEVEWPQPALSTPFARETKMIYKGDYYHAEQVHALIKAYAKLYAEDGE